MRLSGRLLDSIKKCALKSFGKANVYLFGSRVDDAKFGGDIDIAIDTDISKEEFKQKKIKFISSMLRLGIELKIDLVQYRTSDKLLCAEIQIGGVKIS
jgi:predicted nucleotidyltransferase